MLRQHLLEPGVLRLQGLQLPRIRQVHAAILRTPFAKRGVADPVFPAKLLRPQTSLMLLQDADNLLLREPQSFYRLSPQMKNRQTPKQGLFRGAGHCEWPSFQVAERRGTAHT